jgi:hypothetical protein
MFFFINIKYNHKWLLSKNKFQHTTKSKIKNYIYIYIMIFLLLKPNLKTKRIIQHLSAKLDIVVRFLFLLLFLILWSWKFYNFFPVFLQFFSIFSNKNSPKFQFFGHHNAKIKLTKKNKIRTTNYNSKNDY